MKNLQSIERPILFSTPMVQAIIDGRKTQTRRVIKPQPAKMSTEPIPMSEFIKKANVNIKSGYSKIIAKGPYVNYIIPNCHYGQIGDVLYVRETFAPIIDIDNKRIGWYHSTDSDCHKGPWKPSIHMPKDAARIWLKITDIRVERLQDISEKDAIAEGVENPKIIPADNFYLKNFKTTEALKNLPTETEIYKNYKTNNFNLSHPRASFMSLWEKINGDESLNANPFVWVVEFEVLSKNGKPSNL